MSRHGTINEYRAGCRCDPCKQANSDYARRYRKTRTNAVPEFRVPGPWVEHANCRLPEYSGIDFYPAEHSGHHAKLAGAAIRACCAMCPVRDECLAFGMGEIHGWWGGYSRNERKRMRSRANKSRWAVAS